MNDSLSLLLKKLQLWANRSRRFLQKSDERELLFSKAWREWFINFLEQITLLLFWTKKPSIPLKMFVAFNMFLTGFPIFMPKSEALPSLFAPLLFWKERPWGIRYFALALTKNERFAWKTKERIPKRGFLLSSCCPSVCELMLSRAKYNTPIMYSSLLFIYTNSRNMSSWKGIISNCWSFQKSSVPL